MRLWSKFFPKLIPKIDWHAHLVKSANKSSQQQKTARHRETTRSTSKNVTDTASDDRNGVGRRKQRRTTETASDVGREEARLTNGRRRRRIDVKTSRSGPNHVQNSSEILRKSHVDKTSALISVQARSETWTGQIAGTTPRDPGAYSSLRGGGGEGGVEKLLFRESCKSGEKIGG